MARELSSIDFDTHLSVQAKRYASDDGSLKSSGLPDESVLIRLEGVLPDSPQDLFLEAQEEECQHMSYFCGLNLARANSEHRHDREGSSLWWF